MSNLVTERVLSVHHWNESLFSFRTTRNPGLRFANGQFVMIGLDVGCAVEHRGTLHPHAR